MAEGLFLDLYAARTCISCHDSFDSGLNFCASVRAAELPLLGKRLLNRLTVCSQFDILVIPHFGFKTLGLIASVLVSAYRPLLQSEPRCEKTGLRDCRPGPTQIRLYSHRRWLEA